jgi:hypothetical protein
MIRRLDFWREGFCLKGFGGLEVWRLGGLEVWRLGGWGVLYVPLYVCHFVKICSIYGVIVVQRLARTADLTDFQKMTKAVGRIEGT